MNKSTLLIVLLITAFCLVSFSSVLADQDGNTRWCNSDQYGCWVTGDNGEKCYILFYSEFARDYIMGKGSSAVVSPMVPGGTMSLGAAPNEAPKAGQAADSEEELSPDEMIDAIAAHFGVELEEYDKAEMKYIDDWEGKVKNVYDAMQGNASDDDLLDMIYGYLPFQ